MVDEVARQVPAGTGEGARMKPGRIRWTVDAELGLVSEETTALRFNGAE